MTGDTDRRETRGRHRVDDPLNFDDIIQFEWIDLPDDTQSDDIIQFEWIDLPDDTQSDDIMQFGWIDFLDGRKADTDEEVERPVRRR